MIPVPDEMLMAYADGELSPEERKALEALLAGDAVLRARLEPFVETRVRIAAAFEPTLYEPVPERLIAAVARRPAPAASRGSPAPRLPLADRLRNGLAMVAATLFPDGFSPALAASAVALLAVGAAAGWIAGRHAPAASGLVAVAGPGAGQGGLVAAGPLALALEQRPSRTSTTAGARGAWVVPLLTFRTDAQGICREYRVLGAAADRDFAGLACRGADGAWRVAVHVETPPLAVQDKASYETATGASVPAVDAVAETLMSGDALGPDEEAALIRNGWSARRN